MKKSIFVDFTLPEKALELLKQHTESYELRFATNPATSVLAQGDTDPQLFESEIVFGQPDPSALLQADKLEWAHISSSGITRYDVDCFRREIANKNVPVTNSANVYNEACADHVFAFMLAQSRQLPNALASQAADGSPQWNDLRNDSIPLRGQKLLIVGYGAIGSRLAELVAPYAMNVVAYRRKERGDEIVKVITGDQLREHLANADHIVNILPNSDATKNFFDANRLDTIKPEGIFYNIGRGTTVDQEALFQTLLEKRIKAAWLDVTEPEPLPADHPLYTLDNCFITPHIAGGHRDESCTLVRHFLANLLRFEKGEDLIDRVM